MTVAKDIALSMKLLFHSEFRFDFKDMLKIFLLLFRQLVYFGSVSMRDNQKLLSVDVKSRYPAFEKID